jgi:hypothetical protein
MSLPADQRLLFDDLAMRLAAVDDQGGLVRFMAQVLRTLLRREGDTEFLAAVQGAFTDGIAGRPFDEQCLLAREVMAVVIAKRPEIARAWQALHGDPAAVPFHRRASDQPPEPAPPAAASPPAELAPAALPPEPLDPKGAAEDLVAGYIEEVLRHRIDLLKVPLPPCPSIGYCHDKPFFLFSPAFAEMAREFVTGPLMAHCRFALQRRVYRHATEAILVDAAARKAFLADKRPMVWKVILEKLAKLAAAHKTAEAKLAAAAAAAGEEPAPGFRMVEVSVMRPRVYRILGVEFSLGSETVTKQVRVKAPSPTELDAAEQDAMALIAVLRDVSARHGLDLPAAVDFQFLRTLFDFDARRFAQSCKELMALAGHKETSRQFLFERLKTVDETYSNYLSDILVIMLFYRFGDGAFGFRELYDVCVGSALDKSALVSKRPFVPLEVNRRPRELALQIGETLRRRQDADSVLAAVEMLLDGWEIMAHNRFREELAAALTVLGDFPRAFAGDPDEAAFTDIGRIVAAALAAKSLDRGDCLRQVSQAIDSLAQRHG